MKTQLTLEETRRMFLYVAEQLIDCQNILTEADRAIGDGDHGVGMARGFEAVQLKLANATFSSLDEIFKSVGTTLLTTIGGAAGAIFGTWFRSGANNLTGKSFLDSRCFALFLKDGLAGIQERGKAKVGDKTIVDVLAPAAAAAEQNRNEPLGKCLAEVALAADQGMESTKNFIASVGKAKTLGERSLGFPDPGAVSSAYILKSMASFVNNRQQKSAGRNLPVPS
jgi:dihydroxyacetone kinase-like protein